MSRIADYLRKLDSVGASDLLLSSDRPPLYRAQSELLPLPGEGTLDDVTLRAGLRELMSPDEWASLVADRELAFAIDLGPDMRARAFCSTGRHGLSARLTRLRSSGVTLADLQLPASFAHWAAAESGLLIVTGPSSSGKTTLLGAIGDLVCRQGSVQLTRLDRFDEYPLDSGLASVATRRVGKHVANYTRAIEAALEADSDVIACGSLDAPGAFALAIEAACSGAFVLGELPGHGSVNAIEQLLLTAAARERSQLAVDLAECLLAVVSLDLLPKKGGGRVPAFEVLLCTPNVAALLRDGKTSMLPGLLDREAGMQSMDRCLLDLASRGAIEGREAYARAIDKRPFAAWG